ncbi:MAG TPA: hypothetical protein VFI33_15325 [Puia sp.]|nr:hypothetical protein [Puia sp.]
MKMVAILICVFIMLNGIQAQTKSDFSLKDSLDGSFDMSDYIINAHGFIPVPYVITEPALGGFGLAVAPVFIKRRPPIIDSIRGKEYQVPVPPDITGGVAAYTANKTWLLAALRSGTIVKYRIKYRIAAGYANINLAFYRTLPRTGKEKYEFNFRSVPLFVQAIKRIGFSHWYAGLNYMFLKSQVSYTGTLPSFVKPLELNSLVSQLGAVIELDKRDNVFTPDSGMKVHFESIYSGKLVGSDYEFWKLNYYLYAYRMLSPNVVLGLRLDGQQALGTPPFYLLPYVTMRGIPIAEYQGNAVVLAELETRWDFTRRWSAVFFGGSAKAFNEWSDFGSSPYIFSYGTGFRYLLARKFKLRVGIDIAHGAGAWAYYIVFGSNWQK